MACFINAQTVYESNKSKFKKFKKEELFKDIYGLDISSKYNFLFNNNFV